MVHVADSSRDAATRAFLAEIAQGGEREGKKRENAHLSLQRYLTWNGFRRDALSTRPIRFNIFTVAGVRNISRARFQIAPSHLSIAHLFILHGLCTDL